MWTAFSSDHELYLKMIPTVLISHLPRNIFLHTIFHFHGTDNGQIKEMIKPT